MLGRSFVHVLMLTEKVLPQSGAMRVSPSGITSVFRCYSCRCSSFSTATSGWELQSDGTELETIRKYVRHLETIPVSPTLLHTMCSQLRARQLRVCSHRQRYRTGSSHNAPITASLLS